MQRKHTQSNIYTFTVIGSFTMRINALILQRLEEQVEDVAFKLFRNGRGRHGAEAVRDRRLRAWIGVSAHVAAVCWHWLANQGSTQARGASMDCHLWGLYLLKSYDTEENCASRCGGVDENTFEHWVWHFVDEISFLEGEIVSSFECLCLPSTPLTFTLSSL